MTAPDQIISDEEVTRVHGHANFGGLTPRQVIAGGVLKYAYGYSSGYTQLTILLEHGLIRKPKPGSYQSTLTKKGQKYLRAAWPIQNVRADLARPTPLAEALAVPQIKALVGAAKRALQFTENTESELGMTLESGDMLRAALRAIGEGRA